MNNLSFPLIMHGDPVSSIPSGVDQGDASLAGKYFVVIGSNPPCDPDESTCDESQADSRVYLQKDPANQWQAYSVSNLTSPVVISHLDVADNLESVPWRTSSVVRIEFVPFAETDPYTDATNPMTGFKMVYVSGQGVDEVWGAEASTGTPPVATVEDTGYATVQSTCMALNIAKLVAGPTSIEDAPIPGNYMWDQTEHIWRTMAAGNPPVAQSETIAPFGAEINVKGRLIFGQNWNLKRQSMETGVSKDGWWRLTFFSTCNPSPMTFNGSTLAFDPTAEPEVTVAAEEEGQYPNYPRTPYIDTTSNQLVYIDIFIRPASGKGGSGGGGQGKGVGVGGGGGQGKNK